MPTGDAELSVYANDRRYTLRSDVFVSLRGGAKGGELLTKTSRCKGGDLKLNYSTSAGGSIRAELRTFDGRPLPGYCLRDCEPLVGDHIERVLRWQGDRSTAALTGQRMQLRFVMEDGDLYSLRFEKRSPSSFV